MVLILAGTSLAMSVERRRRDGKSVDGHIAIRGLLLIALEVLWMIPLRRLPAHVLGMTSSGGLVHTYLAAAAVVALLLPLCWWYRSYKLRHPNSLARFI